MYYPCRLKKGEGKGLGPKEYVPANQNFSDGYVITIDCGISKKPHLDITAS